MTLFLRITRIVLWFTMTLGLSGLAFVFSASAQEEVHIIYLPSITGTEPTEIQLVSQIGGGVRDVAIQGNYAYLVTGRRLQTVDISNPEQPTLVHETSDLGEDEVWRIAITDSHIYLAGGRKGLWVVDLQSPANPTPLIHLDLSAFKLAVEGARLYADSGREITILDISNPAAPIKIGSFPLGENYINAMHIHESLAYLYTFATDYQTSALRVVDLLDVANPRELSMLPLDAGYGESIAVQYPFVYLGIYSELHVFDVANSESPEKVRVVRNLANIRGLVIHGNSLYAVDTSSNNQIFLLDISNPSTPRKLGEKRLAHWQE